MCTEPVCLEGVDFQPRGAVIQAGYAYLDGLPFAVLIRDSRYEGLKHLHFPAGELDAFALFFARPEGSR